MLQTEPAHLLTPRKNKATIRNACSVSLEGVFQQKRRKKRSCKNISILRDYTNFSVLSCQGKLRSCISRAGWKESRRRNARSEEPSSACFAGPGGKPRALGCSEQQRVTAATLHRRKLPRHPRERAGRHRQAHQRGFGGGYSLQRGPSAAHSRWFAFRFVCHVPPVQGWQGRGWQWCRKALLARSPLAGSAVLRPPPAATKHEEESAPGSQAGGIQAFANPAPAQGSGPPSHGEASD